MNRSPDHRDSTTPSSASPGATREIELALADLEGLTAPEQPSLRAMHEDRRVLRAALHADSARLSKAQQARVAAAVEEEWSRQLLRSLEPARSEAVAPRWVAGADRAARRGPGSTRAWAAMAAMVAMAGLATWMAIPFAGSGRTRTGGETIAQRADTGSLPAWAVLPERPPVAIARLEPKVEPAQQPTDELALPSRTTETDLALAWAREGMLAIRLRTETPRSDRELLNAWSEQDASAERGNARAAAPRRVEPSRTWEWSGTNASWASAMITPERWPISSMIAGDSAGPIGTPTTPPSGTLALYELRVQLTPRALEQLRREIESRTGARVVFERVPMLASAAPQAEWTVGSDPLWWTRRTESWTPAVRVPVALDFVRFETSTDRR